MRSRQHRPDGAEGPQQYPGSWHNRPFRAMGSDISLWLESESARAADTAFNLSEELFAANEQALSRFRPDSELMRLNGRPGAWVSVSQLLWDVLQAALVMARETAGLFDPTMLDALEDAGYTRSFDQLAASQNGRSRLPAPEPGPAGAGWTAIQMNPKERAVRLPAGARLDLGGIAKGHTAQQAAELLGQWGPCLVDAGGDLTAGAPPTSYDGWPVAVAAPATWSDGDSGDLFALWLADASLATSGIDRRRWQNQVGLAHHLIDPRTRRPADSDALTVTVLAAEATVAEAWATSALIAGSDAGLAALAAAGLPAAMVLQDWRLLLTPSMTELIV